ncbi:phage tail protein [Xanthobacter sp. YC-JY1]|nr:phage tail protein [Xanthobacter sp. YC-JY1]
MTSGTIPNLLGGVSQQALVMRLPSQGDLQENFYSTIVKGLKKRPPTEHVARILSAVPAGAFFHIIDRDESERYVAVLSSGTLRVFDFQGVEKTVNAPNGWGYLSGATSPAEDYKALTVADYTFIVNTCKTVQMGAAASPVRVKEALIHVMQGNYGKSYKVLIDGTVVAHYLVPKSGLASNEPAADTTFIAQVLIDGTDPNDSGMFRGPDGTEGRAIYGQASSSDNTSNVLSQGANAGRVVKIMTANGITAANGWTVTRYQNAIHVSKATGDFTISVEDGFNGNAMKVVKGTAQRFSDLPAFGPVGFVAEVSGDDGTTQDNYWVKITKEGSDADSTVIWKETVKGGVKLGFDAGSMPHTLVREADGTFTFKPAEWDPRKCGDADKISPDPSFVGNTITDIFFHRNRLGFLSDESVIMSRSGSFFDFWRTTATALLDDDPIDVAASHIKVSLLKHALPTQDYLLVFSTETQFRLAGNDLLTPKSVSLRPLTEFSCSKRVKPVMTGKSVFFVSDALVNRDWAAVYDFFFDKSTETGDAQSVTSHVPSYIPTGVRKIAASPDQNVLVALSDGDPGALYVYSFFWQDNQKVLSSWCRWTFNGATILDLAFLNSQLALLVSRDGAVWLETLRMEPAATDESIGALVGLDRRVGSSALAAPAYSLATDETTYTLPFPVAADTQAVVTGGTGVVGSNAVVKRVSGATLVLRGDTRGEEFLFGRPYVSRYRFSAIFPRRTGSDGGTVTQIDGRLQLHHLTLSHDTAGYFRVEVTPEGRPTSAYDFSGRIFGDPGNVLGKVVLATGRFNVPIMSRSDRVKVEIINDTWLPSGFMSGGWRGSWNPKLRQT